MTGNPYVRSELAATRAGVPDPNVEVACWIEDLEAALARFESMTGRSDEAAEELGEEATSDRGDGDGTRSVPTTLYDLIAAWGRLRRVRPELVGLAGDELLARADLIMADQGRGLVQQALGVPYPAAWLEDAQRLDDGTSQFVAPDREHGHVAELLADLDDVELVAAAACRFGVPDADLEAELDRCRQWLFDHLDLFLVASVTVQAIGQSLRPDLEEYDYDLAATAIKYEALLDEARVAEADLTLANVRPLPTQVVQRLYDQFCGERSHAVRQRQWAARAFPRDRLPSQRIAAKGGVPVLTTILRWDSPDGRHYAFLSIPAEASLDQRLVLEIFQVTGDAVADLSGQTAQLGGAPAEIDAAGHAVFSLQAIVATQEELWLIIGASLERWIPHME